MSKEVTGARSKYGKSMILWVAPWIQSLPIESIPGEIRRMYQSFLSVYGDDADASRKVRRTINDTLDGIYFHMQAKGMSALDISKIRKVVELELSQVTPVPTEAAPQTEAEATEEADYSSYEDDVSFSEIASMSPALHREMNRFLDNTSRKWAYDKSLLSDGRGPFFFMRSQNDPSVLMVLTTIGMTSSGSRTGVRTNLDGKVLGIEQRLCVLSSQFRVYENGQPLAFSVSHSDRKFWVWAIKIQKGIELKLWKSYYTGGIPKKWHEEDAVFLVLDPDVKEGFVSRKQLARAS